MKDEHTLDPEIASLLREEGESLEAPAGAGERVFARLALTLPVLGVAGGDGGSGSGGSGGDGGGSPVAGALPTAVSRLAPVIVSFVIGATTGALVMRTSTPPPAARTERIVYVERPALIPSAIHETDAPAAVLVSALPTVTTQTSASSALPVDVLAKERTLLDTARIALAHGEHAVALESLQQHEREYRSGKLVEEREALFVRVLADVGELAPARARAETFRRRFPQSLLLPAVEAAVVPPP